MTDLVERLRRMAGIETSALFSQRATLNEAASELERLRRHIELLQEKDTSQCGCSIDRPDDVCLFHGRMKAEARKAAFIEAAEIAEAYDTGGYGRQDNMTFCQEVSREISSLIRSKAEGTGR